MTIALIIYGTSWLLLLLVYLYSRFIQGSTSSSREPWYLYAIIIAAAPLVVFIIPYILINDAIKNKKNKKWQKEEKEKQRLVEIRRNQSVANYQSASLCSCQADCVHSGATLRSLILNSDYDSILQCLNKLSLPIGYKLKVKIAEHKGSGDRSRLFISEPCGDTIEDVFSTLNVEDSAQGAMHVYLLYKAWHYLPLFWHANYSHRSYIYAKDDLFGIRMFRKEEKTDVVRNLMEYDITPIVKHNGNRYYVNCCFWSDFGGLIRELVEIEIKDNKIIDIFDVNQTVLFEYKCGIRY